MKMTTSNSNTRKLFFKGTLLLLIFMNSFLRKFQIMENLFKNVCLRSLVSFFNLTSSTLVQSCICSNVGIVIGSDYEACELVFPSLSTLHHLHGEIFDLLCIQYDKTLGPIVMSHSLMIHNSSQ